MKVRDLMTADVVAVGRGASFKEIAETLVRHGISSVPVVDGVGRLLGIVSEADLMPREASARVRRGPFGAFGRIRRATTSPERRVTGLFAQGMMTTKVITADPREDVRKVARRMLDQNLKRLPVVEDGRLVGIISRADLMRVFARSDASICASVEGLLRRCLYAPPEADIIVSVHEGVVSLRGSVLHESDVKVAGAIVEASEGVIAVDNHLVGREPDPRPSHLRRPDSYATRG